MLAKTEPAECWKRNDNIFSFTSTTNLCTLQTQQRSHFKLYYKPMMIVKYCRKPLTVSILKRTFSNRHIPDNGPLTLPTSLLNLG